MTGERTTFALASWVCVNLLRATAACSQTPVSSDIELHFGGLGTDGANTIAPLADGGFALGGWKSTLGERDVTEGWILRVDRRGGYVWDIPLPRSAPYGVVALSPSLDGGLLAVDRELNSQTGTTRLSKLSPDGSIEWQRTYGNTEQDGFSVLRPTFDGGLILAGKTSFRATGESDGWIVKLDRRQEVEWFRVLGGDSADAFDDLALTTDGGYIAAGWTTIAGDNAIGWTVKLNGMGATQWRHQHDLGAGTEFHDVLPTADGSYVFTASRKNDQNQGRRIVLGGMTEDGKLTWRREISADHSATATGLSRSTRGTFLLSASIQDTDGQAGLVTEFNQNGTLGFMHRHPGSGDHRALAITALPSTGYAVAGTSQRVRTLDQDVWLLIKRNIQDSTSSSQGLAP